MCERCDRSERKGRVAVFLGMVVLWTCSLLIGFSLSGCNSSWGTSSGSTPQLRWQLIYENDSNVAQVVTVTTGFYVISTIRVGGLTLPAGGALPPLCMTVKAHDEVRFYFAEPPSFVEVQDGGGKTFRTWAGKPAPNYECPFWAWEYRFPSRDQQGLYPY
jgi:hypothetical protein